MAFSLKNDFLLHLSAAQLPSNKRARENFKFQFPDAETTCSILKHRKKTACTWFCIHTMKQSYILVQLLLCVKGKRCIHLYLGVTEMCSTTGSSITFIQRCWPHLQYKDITDQCFPQLTEWRGTFLYQLLYFIENSFTIAIFMQNWYSCINRTLGNP